MKSLTHYTKGTPSPRTGAPTACRLPISGSVSLPLSGCFSPFPHGTCSLSVAKEYLGLEGGPPMFRQDFSCPAVLRCLSNEPAYCRLRGCHPLWPIVPDRSTNKLVGNSSASRPNRSYNPTVQAQWFGLCPRSLAATSGITFVFCSSGY